MKCFALVTIVLLLCGMTLAVADVWDIYLTIDNFGTVYYGTNTVTVGPSVGTSNTWTTEDHFTTTQPSNAYLYVATGSDHAGLQGFVGRFTNTTLNRTAFTGDPAWEVFPAGKYATDLGILNPWPASTQPTQAQVDAAIAYATANNLWVPPTTAPGYDLDPNTPTAPYGYVWGYAFPNIWSAADLPDQAQWIWYESGLVPTNYYSSPFQGGNHQEFLVFRIAGDILPVDSCNDVWITPNPPWDCPDIWLNNPPVEGQTVTITANIHNTGFFDVNADIKFEWGYIGTSNSPSNWNHIGTNSQVLIPINLQPIQTSISWFIPSAAIGHSCVRVTIVQPTTPPECNITPANSAWENLWVVSCMKGEETEITGPVFNPDNISRDILVQFRTISMPMGWDAWISDSLLEQVGPGETQDVTVLFSVPSTTAPGDSAVVNFEVYLLPEGDHIGGTDIKATIVQEEQIPTLTEWGMIIFCVLLFGFMAWMIVRRRKTMEVGI